jgi:diadenosine tetraphosphatase ApaH/serine/threonine PP2A family protein phosphatase
VERLEAEEVDVYVCAGDLVGYGPFPNECVELVAGLRGITCAAGNHDLIALGRLGFGRCVPLAQRTLEWTREVLGADARAWLEALPLDARLPGGLVVAHGALGDPEEYVRRHDQVRRELAKLGERDEVLVLGHTHAPLFADDDVLAPMALGRRIERGLAWEAGPVVVNPGSAGQSRTRDVRALMAIVDLDGRSAKFYGVAYDAEATRRALRERGLPENACHLPPAPLPRRVAGRVVRALRRG